MLKHYLAILTFVLVALLVGAEPAGSTAKVDLTAEEQAFLAGKELRLGIDDARPPFEFITETGEYAGISAGFVEALAARLGLTIVPKEGMKWPDAMEKVKTGEIDVIPKVTPTRDREKFLIFTRPYASFPSVIVTHRDRSVKGLTDLSGLRVGVVKGLVVESSLKRDHPELSLVPLPDIETSLRQLATGKLDAFIDNLGTVSYTIDKLGLVNLKIAAETPYTHDLAIGVRKDWPLLASALDKALASMTEEEKTAIKNRWLSIQYHQGVDWGTVGPVGAGLLLVICFILSWNRHLGRAVRKREQAEQGLKENARMLEWRSQIKTRVAEIAADLQQATSFEELARKLMSRLTPLVGADCGVFYVLDGSTNHLRPVGGYAWMDSQSRQFALGQGLVGQCALEQKVIMITDTAETRIRINWGLGETTPKAVLLQPVVQTGHVLGVIELATLKSFGEEEQALLDELLPLVAMNFEIIARNLQTQQLLEDSIEQTKSILLQQEQLQETEAWYRSIIESAPDGILVADDQGIIILTNTMTDTIFGYQSGELLGRNVDILVPPAYRATLGSKRENFMKGGVGREMETPAFDLRGMSQDGSEFPVAIGLSKLPMLGSRGLCVCVSIRQVTEKINRSHEDPPGYKKRQRQDIPNQA
ncbi:MAG: transporter substrate-binding domain-containing protein [Deltaproteobacteria bacterium]|nr:transporter substrate-binding domain-containing protein [Deltaproteobacteria bacterium]